MELIPQWQLDKILTALYEPLPPKPPKLVIEAEVPRNMAGRKFVYHFNDSWEALQARGYERHLRPVEAFSLLEKNLEGTLSEEEQEIAENMIYPLGEWLSLAWERKGDMLVAYLDPVGLVWDENEQSYAKQDFSYSEEKRFDISGKASYVYVNLQEFSEDFVLWHYGRKFAELPEKMREGDKRACVRLPDDGIIWPVSSCGYGIMYKLISNYSFASRGVKHQCN